MLAASMNYPIRGAVTWKSTVGTNVASDALSNLASGGCHRRRDDHLGEDYGEGSSIMQERTHAFAMKSQMWLLDPRPNLPTIVRMAVHGLRALRSQQHAGDADDARSAPATCSAASSRGDNRRPPFTYATRSSRRCAHLRQDHPAAGHLCAGAAEDHERWPAAVRFIAEHQLNEFLAGDVTQIGIVVQGGLFNNVLRALERLGLADLFGSRGSRSTS
jgi:indolepyruvate ferredoxin oxidoreductase alpha subunit